MLITIVSWTLCFAAGIAMQRRLRDPQRASHILFVIIIWIAAPLVVVYAYTTVAVRVELLAAFAAVVAASWITLLIGMVWGRMTGRKCGEQGVMAFATCMGNTSSVGFPLTTIVFGGPGLALAVIYAEFQYLVPVEGVLLGLGRHFAGPGSRATPAPGLRRLVRSWLLNPPVVAGAVAVTLRLLGVDLTDLVTPLGPAVGAVYGLIGFVQLGLATPLKPVVHDRAEVWRALATIVLRSGVAPLILLVFGWIFGIHIPGVFLLLAAMPVAFNTLVVAAVFDLDDELARLMIAISTPLVIAGVLIWQFA
jgi:predicted permease